MEVIIQCVYPLNYSKLIYIYIYQLEPSITGWKKNENDKFERIMKYLMPVSIPMGNFLTIHHMCYYYHY
jgi:hypothetical protein